jgi:GrpB-like predicted nucleotidyltransferase (UPF0157 family)
VTRDEELRAVTVGALRRQDAPVELVEYDASWPERFLYEAERIQATLRDKAIAIEHVGSTSVPGLAAKPIVDILLVVSDASDEPAYVPSLEKLGYVLRVREPDWFDHRMLKGANADINLHVLPAGCSEIERMLRFRDHLRADRADRALYERVKRALASRTWAYIQDYADAKTTVINEIMSRTRSA